MIERHRIRVSSRALGERRYVKVWVYESLDEMRKQAAEFNGSDVGEGFAVTQAWTDESGRAGSIVVRLWRGSLGAEIISHEMLHAATAIYGSYLGDRISRAAHLTHYNEPFTYLFSDLVGRLNERLSDLGYYR